MVSNRTPRVWRDQLVDHAFGLGWTLGGHTPEPVTAKIMEGAADVLSRRRGAGVWRLESNLTRAAPGLDVDERQALTREAVRSYFRYWHEAFRLPSWSAQRTVDTIVTTNEQPLRDGFARGGGAIIALPHMANWDLAGAWACLTGMPVTTVAERLRPESLYDRFVSYRESLGMEVVALTGSVDPLQAMRDALRRGRLVCLLADRDLTGAGVEVDLLGEAARLPGGPAVLARLTGAPLVALNLSFVGPLMRMDFSDPVPVRRGRDGIREMTQEIADTFSAGIRRTPQDWHMLQRVFVADLARDLRAGSRADMSRGPGARG